MTSSMEQFDGWKIFANNIKTYSNASQQRYPKIKKLSI